MFRILSLGGGGCRGLIQCCILVKLEELLQEKTGNPKARVIDYFDFVAGTSTGSIVGTMLLLPHRSAKDILQFYLADLARIFQRAWSLGGWLRPKYYAEPLEELAEKYCGLTKLSDLPKDKGCLITAYNLTEGKPHFFTNLLKQGHAETKDFYLKDVIRASTAAPTYFPPAQVTNLLNKQVYTMLDGGTFANDPSLCALAEAAELPMLINKGRNFLMVSISCGKMDDRDVKNVTNRGKPAWIEPLISILIDGNSATTNHVDRQVFTALGLADQFFHLNCPLLTASPALDDIRPENLVALQNDAWAYLNAAPVQVMLDQLVNKLTAKQTLF